MATDSKFPTDESAPLTIDVQIDKREAQIAERIQLEITATAPEDVTVKFPELAGKLGDFEVTSVKDTLDIPTARTAMDSARWSGKLDFWRT